MLLFHAGDAGQFGGDDGRISSAPVGIIDVQEPRLPQPEEAAPEADHDLQVGAVDQEFVADEGQDQG